MVDKKLNTFSFWLSNSTRIRLEIQNGTPHWNKSPFNIKFVFKFKFNLINWQNVWFWRSKHWNNTMFVWCCFVQVCEFCFCRGVLRAVTIFLRLHHSAYFSSLHSNGWKKSRRNLLQVELDFYNNDHANRCKILDNIFSSPKSWWSLGWHLVSEWRSAKIGRNGILSTSALVRLTKNWKFLI